MHKLTVLWVKRLYAIENFLFVCVCESLNSPFNSRSRVRGWVCTLVFEFVFPASEQVAETRAENESVVGKLSKDHLHLRGERASQRQPSTLERRHKDTYT